ncbi:MAG: pyroglutamyl-peptidase I [Firmicutes bacterium HGW-Firmicutes-20]|jgi:pyroglutamyl-peptidase|nr:MAG: pyroglutamyl-peptidase I [Firmicutes bacterium HGW-Firmicutes-20]PKM89249.1 MAG: pyroglutamyl-peptidase I [Firmicutes bacterium HGW-Firmicutes-10]
MKILVSAFEPFGKEMINPSLEILKLLPDQILGQPVIKLKIPTVRYKSVKVIIEAIEAYRPDVVLSLGQAGGRPDITFERVGINIDDYGIEDNEHNMPSDEKIDENGPDAYFVNLPIKDMMHRLRDEGIASSISNTAGTFICNHVIYSIRHYCELKQLDVCSGFIHVPFLPEQIIDKPSFPSMPLETMVKGITLAIETIIKKESDMIAS